MNKLLADDRYEYSFVEGKKVKIYVKYKFPRSLERASPNSTGRVPFPGEEDTFSGCVALKIKRTVSLSGQSPGIVEAEVTLA